MSKPITRPTKHVFQATPTRDEIDWDAVELSTDVDFWCDTETTADLTSAIEGATPHALRVLGVV